MEIAGYILVAFGFICFIAFVILPATRAGFFLTFDVSGGLVLLILCLGLISGDIAGTLVGLLAAGLIFSMLAAPFVVFYDGVNAAVFVAYLLIGLANLGVWIYAFATDESGKWADDWPSYSLFFGSIISVTLGLGLLV